MANRDFTSSQRDTIWRKYCGNNNEAFDAFGIRMTKSNFECDHIWPKSRGGSTTVKNGQPLSSRSNQEKSDNISGYVNRKSFKVDRDSRMYVNGRLVTKY